MTNGPTTSVAAGAPVRRPMTATATLASEQRIPGSDTPVPVPFYRNGDGNTFMDSATADAIVLAEIRFMDGLYGFISGDAAGFYKELVLTYASPLTDAEKSPVSCAEYTFSHPFRTNLDTVVAFSIELNEQLEPVEFSIIQKGNKTASFYVCESRLFYFSEPNVPRKARWLW